MLADLPPPATEIVSTSEQTLAAAEAARLNGDWRNAQSLLRKLVRDEPRNADAWLQLGFAYAAEPDASSARAAFERVLELSASYDDAKIGLARLAYRDGDLPAARLWLSRIGSDRWNDPEVQELRERLSKPADAPRELRAGFSVARSDLSAGLPDWREAEIWISERDGRHAIGASLQAAERFDRTDLFAEFRYNAAGDHVAMSLAAGGAPDADFRPRAALRLEVSTLEDAPWLLSGAVTLARYRAGPVEKLDVRAGPLVGPVRLTALGVAVRDENGETRTGYGAGAMWRLSDRLSLFGSWSDAPETSDGVTVDVRSTSAGLIGHTRAGARVTLGATHEERGAYDRNEILFAVSRAF